MSDDEKRDPRERRVRGRGRPGGPRLLANPVVREAFLDKLQECGKKTLAAHSIGTSLVTVNKYLDEYDLDGDFQRGIQLALEIRAADIVTTIEDQALYGHEEISYDREGNEIIRRKFETALRVKMLERYDRAYQPKSTVVHEGKAGVLAVPIPAGSIEEWEASVAAHANATNREGE
jgi:hypothetical protein